MDSGPGRTLAGPTAESDPRGIGDGRGRRPRLVSFDCYGTLVDWGAGILGAIRRQFPEARRMDEEVILREYHRVEADAEEGPFRPYRAVLAETAAELAARFSWDLHRGDRGFLARSLPDWEPFPDTNPALEALTARGYPLAIASNVDDDLLAGTLRHLDADFDLLVTAAMVESYKPEPAHFEALLAEVEGDEEALLHVAGSPFHDVRPASELGIPVIWLNRRGDERPRGLAPTDELRDLAKLVAWLEERYGE